jgi:hypothetical protein
VIRLELTLTNVGLIEMADPSWSFLSTIRTDNNSFHQGSDITPSHAVLRDVRVPADSRLFQRAMTQATTMPSLRPYADTRLVITMPIGIAPTIGDATFAFAVSARNVLPMWWTIREVEWHGAHSDHARDLARGSAGARPALIVRGRCDPHLTAGGFRPRSWRRALRSNRAGQVHLDTRDLELRVDRRALRCSASGLNSASSDRGCTRRGCQRSEGWSDTATADGTSSCRSQPVAGGNVSSAPSPLQSNKNATLHPDLASSCPG